MTAPHHADSVQFCRSAVLDVAFSALLLDDPMTHPIFGGWVHDVAQVLPDPVLDTVTTLAASVRDPDSWWWQFTQTQAWPGARHVISQTDEDALAGMSWSRATMALDRYFDVAFGHRWDEARLITAEVLRNQDRTIVMMGASAALATIHPLISCLGSRLRVLTTPGQDPVLVTNDRPISVVPSAFVWPLPQVMSSANRHAVVYGIRSLGNLFDAIPPEPGSDATLWESLGDARCQLLNLMQEPTSVAMMAHSMDMPESTVLSHMRMLHRIGVVRRLAAGRPTLWSSPTGPRQAGAAVFEITANSG